MMKKRERMRDVNESDRTRSAAELKAAKKAERDAAAEAVAQKAVANIIAAAKQEARAMALAAPPVRPRPVKGRELTAIRADLMKSGNVEDNVAAVHFSASPLTRATVLIVRKDGTGLLIDRSTTAT